MIPRSKWTGTDWLDKAGSEELGRRVALYWLERERSECAKEGIAPDGRYSVKMSVEGSRGEKQTGDRRGELWGARSDMVNGLPKGWLKEEKL